MEDKVPYIIGVIVIVVIIVALTYSFGNTADKNLTDMAENAAGNSADILDRAASGFGDAK